MIRFRNPIGQSDFYIVYYHPDCPFSRGSIRLLRQTLPNPDLQLLLINVPRAGEHLQSLLERRGITHHYTLPAIFKNSAFIGGYLDLKLLLEVATSKLANE